MDIAKYSKISRYVDANSLAVLSTVNKDGSPHGAAIYVCTDDHRPIIYFVTKTGTQKYDNLIARPTVSLTIVNPSDSSTLQAEGKASVTQDPVTLDKVTSKITRIYATAPEWLPPLSKIRAGGHSMFAIELTKARLAEFKGRQIGDPAIFTEA